MGAYGEQVHQILPIVQKDEYADCNKVKPSFRVTKMTVNVELQSATYIVRRTTKKSTPILGGLLSTLKNSLRNQSGSGLSPPLSSRSGT